MVGEVFMPGDLVRTNFYGEPLGLKNLDDADFGIVIFEYEQCTEEVKYMSKMYKIQFSDSIGLMNDEMLELIENQE